MQGSPLQHPFVHPSVETQLVNTHSIYTELMGEDSWLVTDHPPSTFPAQSPPQDTSGGTCWSCGAVGHSMSECPHPKDKNHIATNCQAFHCQIRSGHSTTTSTSSCKWAPPTPAELAESGHGLIDNCPYTYDASHCFWIPEATMAQFST